MKRLIAICVFFFVSAAAFAQAAPAPKPFVIEYYYKVKWGHQQEFFELFKKNHYPLLKKQIEMGRMLSVSVAAPRYHMTESARWDYRVTIVFKDAATAFGPFDGDALVKQLYPDQATYDKEEQRRFELLEEHTDIPVVTIDMDRKP